MERIYRLFERPVNRLGYIILLSWIYYELLRMAGGIYTLAPAVLVGLLAGFPMKRVKDVIIFSSAPPAINYLVYLIGLAPSPYTLYKALSSGLILLVPLISHIFISILSGYTIYMAISYFGRGGM